MTENRKRKINPKHPGFDVVAARIAKKQGLPIANARAILAASSRRASVNAFKKNPRLSKVRQKGR